MRIAVSLMAYFVVTAVAGSLVLVAVSATLAVLLVCLASSVVVGFAVPRRVVRRTWRRLTTPDPFDPYGRRPIVRMYHDFIEGARS